MKIKKVFESIEDVPKNSPYASIAQVLLDIRKNLMAAEVAGFRDMDDLGWCDRYAFTLENGASYILTIDANRPDIFVVDANTRSIPIVVLIGQLGDALGVDIKNDAHIMEYEFNEFQKKGI
jgi:hypothetical protein